MLEGLPTFDYRCVVHRLAGETAAQKLAENLGLVGVQRSDFVEAGET